MLEPQPDVKAEDAADQKGVRTGPEHPAEHYDDTNWRAKWRAKYVHNGTASRRPSARRTA
jgi:hypothetical protein